MGICAANRSRFRGILPIGRFPGHPVLDSQHDFDGRKPLDEVSTAGPLRKMGFMKAQPATTRRPASRKTTLASKGFGRLKDPVDRKIETIFA